VRGHHLRLFEHPTVRQPRHLAPLEEVGNRAQVGRPGVAVADVGGEELDEAPGCSLPRGGDLTGNRGALPPNDQLLFH
jgi:hypothetical protein